MDSWLASWRTSHAAGVIPMPFYDEMYTRSVEWIRKRDGAETWVAYHPTEQDERSDLYGWCCVEHGGVFPIVHYVFVKQAYRRMGIARKLIDAAGVNLNQKYMYTFKTALTSKLPVSHGSWDPLLARHPRKTEDSTTPKGDLWQTSNSTASNSKSPREVRQSSPIHRR